MASHLTLTRAQQADLTAGSLMACGPADADLDDARRGITRAQSLFELVEAHYKQVTDFIGDGPESGALARVLDELRAYETRMTRLAYPGVAMQPTEEAGQP